MFNHYLDSIRCNSWTTWSNNGKPSFSHIKLFGFSKLEIHYIVVLMSNYMLPVFGFGSWGTFISWTHDSYKKSIIHLKIFYNYALPSWWFNRCLYFLVMKIVSDILVYLWNNLFSFSPTLKWKQVVLITICWRKLLLSSDQSSLLLVLVRILEKLIMLAWESMFCTWPFRSFNTRYLLLCTMWFYSSRKVN